MNRFEIQAKTAWKLMLTASDVNKWLCNNVSPQKLLLKSDYSHHGNRAREEGLIYYGHLMGPGKPPASFCIQVGDGWALVRSMIPDEDASKSYDFYEIHNRTVYVFIEDDTLAVQAKLAFANYEPDDDCDY
jgi:hypothetical protein